MNGEQFQHLSTEIRDLRNDLMTRLDSFSEKLDRKPNKDEIAAAHARLTKHQSEYESDVSEIKKEVATLHEDLHGLEKRVVRQRRSYQFSGKSLLLSVSCWAYSLNRVGL